MSGAASHTVELRGCPLACDVRGAGPPVVFVQGVGVHGDGWRPQTDVLSRRFTCVSFDNRGLGRSQPAGCPITVQRMAEDALGVMDALRWPSAHFVGHSLGGLVALHAALAAPSRVRSLSLLCAFASGRAAAPLSPRMTWLGLRVRLGTRRMRRRAFLRIVLSPDALASTDQDAAADRLAHVFGHDLADQPSVASAQLRAMRQVDLRWRLQELKHVPAVVVNARHDPIAPPRVGRALADGIHGARYFEVPDASHGLPIEHAAWVNLLLDEHIAAADTRWGRA